MLRRDRVGARHAGLAILLGHLGSVCRAGLEPRHRELGASSPPGAARPCPDGDQPAVASPEARGLRAFEDERAAEPTRSSSARLLRQRCDAPQRTRRLSTSFTRMRSVTTASTWAGASKTHAIPRVRTLSRYEVFRAAFSWRAAMPHTRSWTARSPKMTTPGFAKTLPPLVVAILRRIAYTLLTLFRSGTCAPTSADERPGNS